LKYWKTSIIGYSTTSKMFGVPEKFGW
jgi:hypothetical protein